ncbi:MAG: lysine transporter LysE [Chloroflexi bacterium]|nr:MAG: lysine transporter LysE [Chloroflexota bacterium]
MFSHLLALVIPWGLISLSGVMSPGPISTMAVTEGARRGYRAGPLISVGHAVTELVMVGALALGLSQLLQQATVAGVVGLMGGVVLAWMGLDIIKGARGASLSLEPIPEVTAGSPPSNQRVGLVSAGALLSVSNPFWLVWWATVGAANMLRFLEYGLIGLSVFYLSHISLDFGWNSLLAGLARSGRHLVGDRVFRGVLTLCGLLLIIFAVYFVVTGIGFLVH